VTNDGVERVAAEPSWKYRARWRPRRPAEVTHAQIAHATRLMRESDRKLSDIALARWHRALEHCRWLIW
jgi:hypothetical protein